MFVFVKRFNHYIILTFLNFSYLQSDEGNIHLDHILNIKLPTLSPSIEKALGRALNSFENACCDISRTVTIFGYAGKKKSV